MDKLTLALDEEVGLDTNVDFFFFFPELQAMYLMHFPDQLG